MSPETCNLAPFCILQGWQMDMNVPVYLAKMNLHGTGTWKILRKEADSLTAKPPQKEGRDRGPGQDEEYG